MTAESRKSKYEGESRVQAIARVLSDVYGTPRHDNKDDPLDELIFIETISHSPAPDEI